MKNFKGLVVMFALVFGLALAGCSANNDSNNSSEKVTLAAGEEATADANIVVNKEKKEVSYYAEVNGKYFTEPTRHGIVYSGGSNGEKAVLRGLGDEKVFYDAMISVGFKPGNNLTMEDMTKGVKVEGEALDVFISWDGQEEIPFADIIKASEEREMDIRFGGNIENAKAKNTGCVLCLDSCAVGITSNASYETGSSEKIKFYGKDDVLPDDGTKVKVTFKARN